MSIFDDITFDNGGESARELLKKLGGADELSVVLRGHLYVESAINELFARAVPGSEHIIAELGFFEKCKALRNMNLIDAKRRTLLMNLGKLRNEFAHDLNKKINDSDADRLISALDSSHQEWIASISAYQKEAGTSGNLVRLAIVCLWMDFEYDLLPAASLKVR